MLSGISHYGCDETAALGPLLCQSKTECPDKVWEGVPRYSTPTQAHPRSSHPDGSHFWGLAFCLPDLAVQMARSAGPDCSKGKVQASPIDFLAKTFLPLEWSGSTGQMQPYGQALMEWPEAALRLAHINIKYQNVNILYKQTVTFP